MLAFTIACDLMRGSALHTQYPLAGSEAPVSSVTGSDEDTIKFVRLAVPRSVAAANQGDCGLLCCTVQIWMYMYTLYRSRCCPQGPAELQIFHMVGR